MSSIECFLTKCLICCLLFNRNQGVCQQKQVESYPCLALCQVEPNCYMGKQGLIGIHIIKNHGNESVVPLIMNSPTLHQKLICSTHPRAVEKTVSFLVDLDELKHPQDLLSDDVGSWNQTNASKKKYLVTRYDNGTVCNIQFCKTDGSDDIIEVHRRSFVNCSDDTFHKLIVNILIGGNVFHIVYTHYYFDGPDHPVEVKPHGNSKGTIPVLRTYQSTRIDLGRKLDSTKSVRRAVFNSVSTVGGIEKAESSSQIPRGKRQADYIRSSQKAAQNDPIFSLTAKMASYKENEEEKFIRVYNLQDDSPTIALFTDDQVGDLVNFCCNDVPDCKSLAYFDVTFELGPFFLLVGTYRNTTLYRRGTTTCPVMIGPSLICMLKEKQTYITLFNALTSKVPGLQMYLQGYSSDSEVAIRQALAQSFPSSISFLCWIHSKRNITDKCNKLCLSSKLTSTINNDIFGSGGLVYSDTRKEYDNHLKLLMEKWNSLESTEKVVGPKFSKYFHTHKKEDVYNHILIKNSRNAGFGDQLQSTNPIESVNALLKRWQNFTATDMCSFIDDYKKLIDNQKHNVNKAFMNLNSPYVVRNQFRNHINETVFGTEDHALRKDMLKQFRSIHIDSERFRVVMKHRPTPTTTDISLSDDELISIAAADTGYFDDPFRLLVPLFARSDIDALRRKANDIVNNKWIRNGFEDNTFIVRSASAPVPHNIRKLVNGLLSCDQKCVGYTSRNICAHVLAVALKLNCLEGFLQKFSRTSTPNLTKMATAYLSNKPGTKGKSRKRTTTKSPDAVRKVTPKVTKASSNNVDPLDEQFGIVFIKNTRATTCYGCGGKFRESTKSPLPPRPYDIALCRKEFRVFSPAGSFVVKIGKTKENCYYHPQLNCVKRKCHTILPGMFLVSDEILPLLGDAHRIILNEQFSVDI